MSEGFSYRRTHPTRKVMGLFTTGQTIVLGVMLAGICGIFGVMGVLLSTAPRPADQAAITSQQNVSMSLATNTPRPTATIPPPPTPIPGWKPFTGSGVEVWLPESYAGGDATRDPATIFVEFIAAGADPEKNEEWREELLTGGILIFAYDKQPDDSYFFTTFFVSKDSAENYPFDQIVDELIRTLELERNYRVVGKEDFQMYIYQAKRLIVDHRVPVEEGEDPVYRTSVMYVFTVNEDFWVARYITDRDLLSERLPVFDLSARTILIQ